MKTYAFLLVSIATSASVPAANCNDVKTAVAASLDAKHITHYTLDVVQTNKVAAGALVLGSCEGGTKKIVYTRK